MHGMNFHYSDETGGAVFNVGSLEINGIVFAENMAADGGLAIMNEEASLEMENVTFRDNTMSCLPAEEYSDFNQVKTIFVLLFY